MLSWDFNSNYLNAINHCSWPVTPLSKISSMRFEMATKNEIETGQVLMLDRISFDEGKVFAGNREETKMSQYKAYRGDIVVSKINARKGAIGIVESDLPVGTTIHFRVLIPDSTQIDTKFLQLALRSPFCRNQFEIQTGGQGKGEISEERLKSINVPIPLLSVQQKIVAHWEAIKLKSLLADQSLVDLVAELDSHLVKRTKAFDQVTQSKVFLANYARTQQWDVKAGRAAAFISANPDFVRLGDYTEECSETVCPWEDSEKEWPVYGVNNKVGVFLSGKQKGKDFNAPYKKIKKDWFFHNPTRANVGSLGIVADVPVDAITSPEYQVWKLSGGFLPDFMALLIRTNYFLSLVAFNRVGGVKQRMYYSNLAEIRLPMIEDGIQEHYAKRREEILEDILVANQMIVQRKKEIEQMILGMRPMGVS
jgi:Restriction endonuclease S subunits